MARMVHCIKLEKEVEGLDFPPYPGELGKNLGECVERSLGCMVKTSNHVGQ